jgi:O-antigen/teichoic acid export membrane protein
MNRDRKRFGVTPQCQQICGSELPAPLAERSLAALKWNYAGVATKVVSQFLVGVALARLLGPAPFGIYAAVLLVTGVGGLIVERGFEPALIQLPTLSEETIRFAFTSLLLTGVGAAAVLFAAASSVAALFRYPSLKTAMYGSALYLFVYATSVVPSALLRRDLNMKSYQLAQIVAYLIGYVGVGIGGAFVGLGAWSLIGALIMQTLVFVLIAYSQIPHSLRPLFTLKGQRITTFGNLFLVTNLLNWAIDNLDNLVVGRLYGMHALGLYAVSYNLVRTPTNHAMTTLQAVLLATGSRAQDNLHALQKAYRTAVSALLLVLCPLFFGMAAVAPTVVQGIYGVKWAGAETLLLPLALAMPAHALLTGSALLWAVGHGTAERKVEAGTLTIFVIGLYFAAHMSLQMIAWAVLVTYILRALWLTSKILNAVKLSWRVFFDTVRGGLILGIVTAGAFYIADLVLAARGVFALERLAILGCVGILIVAALPICARGQISSPELRAVLQRAVPGSPRFLRPVLSRYARL